MPLVDYLDIAWMDDAACRGLTEIMFPPFGLQGHEHDEAVEVARQVCAECPVLEQCRDYALLNIDTIEQCVIAGMNQSELRAARRNVVARRKANRRPRCGTPTGYQWHLDRGENCVACKAAWSGGRIRAAS